MADKFKPAHTESAFTLLELSVVLVIIGLIIGAILSGQDLIKSSAARAQISQIEKYNSAVGTFEAKYNYLPGDIPNPYATQSGFLARGQYAGEGDGNGILEGVTVDATASNTGLNQDTGETAAFWVDLSQAGLIDGVFNTASTHVVPLTIMIKASSIPNIGKFLPTSKISPSVYVYVWSRNGINYFGVSSVTGLSTSTYSGTGISVTQAYNIDKKIDDGFPATGSVTAEYVNTAVSWTPGYPYGDTNGVIGSGAMPAVAASATTCMDNLNKNNTSYTYSTSKISSDGLNCGLAFQMQGSAR